VQLIQADFEGACQTATAGIASALENDSLVVYLSAHSSLAQALLQLGRLGELLRTLANALDVAEKNGNGPWIGIFRAVQAWTRVQCGDYEEARRIAQELIGEHTGEPAGQIRTMAAIVLAFADLESGKPDAALDRFKQIAAAMADHRFFLDWYWRLIVQYGRGGASLKKGDAEQARMEADALLESARATGDPGLEALAWELQARQPGATGEAIQNAFRAMEKFEPPLIARRVYATAGDHQRAASIVSGLIDSLPAGEPLREHIRSSTFINGQ
jgi:tetratricopeptide (TPR) repeat protein